MTRKATIKIETEEGEKEWRDITPPLASSFPRNSWL